MSYLCEKCGEEFEDHAEYKQHKTDHMLGKISDAPPVVEEPPVPEPKPVEVKKPADPDRKPIKLTYMYEGNCEGCGKHVETLEIDVGNDHFCIAFCTACKVQRTQRKVAKL